MPNADHLKFLLGELSENGYIHEMDSITPGTYTITDKGIKEGVRLSEEV